MRRDHRRGYCCWSRGTVAVALTMGVGLLAGCSNGNDGGSGGASGSSSPAEGAGRGGGAGSGSGSGGAVGGSGGAAGSGGGAAGKGTAGAAGTGAGGKADSGSGGASGAAGVPAGGGGGGGAAGGLGGSGAAGQGGAGGAVATEKFSFFVTSLEAMRRLSKSEVGFGGDLRYGAADGLAGADKICTEIAESSMPGAGAKGWRAFLSTSKVDAIDRIGNGPWYDRLGRMVAARKEDLLHDRPQGAAAAIANDLPNETGTPNHRPDPTMPPADNHHVLTGTGADGKLYKGGDGRSTTCLDWTSSSNVNTTTGRPRIGFSWSIQNRINWISGQDEGGCAAGVAIGENGGSDPSNPIVGSGGGYGGIYCFALMP